MKSKIMSGVQIILTFSSFAFGLSQKAIADRNKMLTEAANYRALIARKEAQDILEKATRVIDFANKIIKETDEVIYPCK